MGAFSDDPNWPPLEREAVAELPEGTPIIVTWGDGNGPHEYVIAVDGNGDRYAAPKDDQSGSLRYYIPLGEFIGTELPFPGYGSMPETPEPRCPCRNQA